jgi:hypothetical protein
MLETSEFGEFLSKKERDRELREINIDKLHNFCPSTHIAIVVKLTSR